MQRFITAWLTILKQNIGPQGAQLALALPARTFKILDALRLCSPRQELCNRVYTYIGTKEPLPPCHMHLFDVACREASKLRTLSTEG